MLVDVDGAELAVQCAGAGHPLLLLPGQANSHRWWTGLRDAFEARYTTITFDYRGTGDTRADEQSAWSTRLFAEDAVRVLDSCGVGSAHVYGTSMGGRVAQLVAARAPERVDRLVLACTSPGGALATSASPAVRRALSQRDRSARRRALLELMYTPDWSASRAESHLLGDDSMSARARGLHLRASNGHDAVEDLAHIVAPTLVLHGDADAMTPVANAHALTEHIDGASLELTAGGRHGFFDEFAGEVTPRVLSFLR